MSGRDAVHQRDERIVIELWPDVAPLACENFLALVTGAKGTSGSSGKRLHYEGCPFHRIVPGFVAQCGDISFGNGTGGESIWGKKFKDDQKGLKQKFNKRGLVAMGTRCTAQIAFHQTFASRVPSDPS